MIMEEIDWQSVVTMENKEWYIGAVILLLLLQAYVFWKTRV